MCGHHTLPSLRTHWHSLRFPVVTLNQPGMFQTAKEGGLTGLASTTWSCVDWCAAFILFLLGRFRCAPGMPALTSDEQSTTPAHPFRHDPCQPGPPVLVLCYFQPRHPVQWLHWLRPRVAPLDTPLLHRVLSLCHDHPSMGVVTTILLQKIDFFVFLIYIKLFNKYFKAQNK